MKRVRNSKSSKTVSIFNKILIFIALFSIVIIVAASYIFLYPVIPGSNSGQADAQLFRYRLKGGDIASQLVNQGVKAPKILLQLSIYTAKSKGYIKPGLYEISRKGTISDIISKGLRGDTVRAKVTLIEGWPFWRIRQELDSNPDLVHATKNLDLVGISELVGLNLTNPEGHFFPSTYFFEPGSSDIEVLKSAQKLMDKKLNEAWAVRLNGIEIQSPTEALILASIIEKETGNNKDREKISAVFHNRLRKDMRLQTDPTVIYGLGEKFNGNLTIRDLRRDTPYNTYTRKGLPPTPIASPGWSSLLATTQPANSKALYFVGMGDGGSYFSETLKEHDAAVDKFQKKNGK